MIAPGAAPLNRAVSHHLPAAAWALLCGALLLVPAETLPEVDPFSWADKLAHLVLFLVLELLAVRSFGRWTRRALAASAAASIAYALLLEAAQLAVPGRAWELWDLGAAAAGVGLAALALSRKRSPRPVRRP